MPGGRRRSGGPAEGEKPSVLRGGNYAGGTGNCPGTGGASKGASCQKMFLCYMILNKKNLWEEMFLL